MSGHDIFISYCRAERPAARRFAETFAGEGFSVWWDAEIHSGETFDEVIERELRAAKAVVVLWSTRSVASRWVRAEATLADRANKLVPIIIEPCDRPIIFELTHAAELADWDGDTSDARWLSLVKDLRRLVGPKQAPAKPEAKPSAVDADEIRRALDRLDKTHDPALSEPTPSEKEQAEFYQRSDEYRSQESDEVHCLLKLDGEELETRYTVVPTGLKIGRAAPADIIVAGSGVSRSHCLIEMAAGQVRVSDLNSTNGTYIDNKRIKGSEVLPVGSVLRVGNVSFEHEVRTREEMQDLEPGQFDLGGDAQRVSTAARH